MTIEEIRAAVEACMKGYPVSKATLFGSRAAGTNRDNSDVDLIIEFSEPVTLMTISSLRDKLEEAMGLDVDLVHGPLQPTDLIEVGKVVELYAA